LWSGKKPLNYAELYAELREKDKLDEIIVKLEELIEKR